MKKKKNKKKNNFATTSFQAQVQPQEIKKINGKREVDLSKITFSGVGYRGKFFPNKPSYRSHEFYLLK